LIKVSLAKMQNSFKLPDHAGLIRIYNPERRTLCINWQRAYTSMATVEASSNAFLPFLLGVKNTMQAGFNTPPTPHMKSKRKSKPQLPSNASIIDQPQQPPS
jgi:hypothetical protein